MPAKFARGLPLPADLEPHLRSALQQILERPGRLIRAKLVYRMSQAWGLGEERATALALAVEYFHTASLVFDDLPCMDDATHRRGEACVHRVHGEATAMLAALALVNRAYALMWQGFRGSTPEEQSVAGAYAEKCLGVAGLLNGQSQDLRYGETRLSPLQIATGKTVSLIQLALVMPAMLGGAGRVEVKLLERLASFWGLSYQILDDLKDVSLTPEQMGKDGAQDAALDRPNLALAVGVSGARQRLDRLMRLGDVTLGRLTRRRDGLGFLAGLRERFRNEIAGLPPVLNPGA